MDELLRPERRLLPEALSDEGIAPADLVAIANSHLHIDHCGQNHLFPGVPIYVQRAEYEAAHSPNYTVPGWVDFPGASYELLDGDAGMIESVRLISTPGHTPGHQSLVVTTGEGLVMLAGQAVYTAAEWEGATNGRRAGLETAWDRERYARSVARLRDLDPRRVFFSHDETVWEP